MTAFDASTLVNLRRVTTVAAAPDGSWLAVAAQRVHDAKYISDLWRVPIAGGDAVRLTRNEWNDHSPAFLPDGSLAFLSNRPTLLNDDEGHEDRAQVFAFRPWGGEPECLTNEPLGLSSFQIPRDDSTIFAMAPVLLGSDPDEQRGIVNERKEKGPTELLYDDMPVRYWDHWLPDQVPHLVSWRDGERTDLTPGARRELFRASWDVAPDGRFVALHPARLGSDRVFDQSAELLDVETQQRRVVAEEARAWFDIPVISPDGAAIAMTYSRRLDGALARPSLLVVDVESGERREVGADFDGLLLPVAWTPDGRSIVATASWRTHAAVFLVDAESGAVTRITAASAGGTHAAVRVVASERGDDPRIVGVRSSLLQPPEPFVCDLQADAEPRVLADISGFDGVDFAETEQCEVTSTDGTSVQYTVVKPREDATGSLLFWIHGGPISDWGDVWHWRWNALVPVAAGHTVALPNPRGSTGFGHEYIAGIWNNAWGGQCYEDLMAVTDELAARHDIDEERMIAMGGSFGGYMTNWIGTQTDRFAGLITHASIFDLAAFHGVTDMPAWWAHSFDVHPYEERADFDRYSPLAHVANWKSPTLIIHGEKDYRVPVGEALSLFEALRFHDVDARLLIYPDENHWILRPKNIESWYGHVLDFLADHTRQQAV